MKIQDQVITLEQAKRLKGLGIAQGDSAFYYYQQFVNGEESMAIYPPVHEYYGSLVENESLARALRGESKNEIYAAFSVAELGVALGGGWISEKTSWADPLKAWICGRVISHKTDEYNYADHVYGSTEAQARAAKLIYLLENNHITADEVNQHL